MTYTNIVSKLQGKPILTTDGDLKCLFDTNSLYNICSLEPDKFSSLFPDAIKITDIKLCGAGDKEFEYELYRIPQFNLYGDEGRAHIRNMYMVHAPSYSSQDFIISICQFRKMLVAIEPNYKFTIRNIPPVIWGKFLRGKGVKEQCTCAMDEIDSLEVAGINAP